MKRYHLAFVKHSNTLILQARKNKDSLSPDTWIYVGERIITKTQLRRYASRILTVINAKYHKSFIRLVID